MKSTCALIIALLLEPLNFVVADGFTSIFDGKSFEGWKAADMSFWSIEDDALTAKNQVKDRAGHFTHHAMMGGAKLKDGRLVLDGTGYLIASPCPTHR